MSKDKEVAVAQQGMSIEAVLQSAIEKNVPVETMEKLLGMRRELKAEAAKEAFLAALADFQAACPVIKKTKVVLNKDGQTVRYKFAPLDSIVEQIKKPLGTSKLSYTWETKQEAGEIKAICTVTHVMGHSQSSEFSVPIDKEGYMTAPQKSASALTFAKRYSLCNALGISTGDEDTDATDVNKEKEALNPKSKIVFLLRTLKVPHKSKEDIEKSVEAQTGLKLEENNYPAIVERLEEVVKEIHESADVR